MTGRGVGAALCAARNLLPALLLPVLLPACAGKKPPEERVRAFVARAEEAAEARDLSALKEMVSADYADQSGRNRRGLMGILTVHFMRNESVHLLTRIAQIRLDEPARAEVTVFVAMAGTPIPEAGELRRLRADLYRFDLRLDETPGGKWQLRTAAWRPAAPADFL